MLDHWRMKSRHWFTEGRSGKAHVCCIMLYHCHDICFMCIYIYMYIYIYIHIHIHIHIYIYICIYICICICICMYIYIYTYIYIYHGISSYTQLYPQKCHSHSIPWNPLQDPPCGQRRVTLGSGIVTSPRCANDEAIKPGELWEMFSMVFQIISNKHGKIMENTQFSKGLQQQIHCNRWNENSQTWSIGESTKNYMGSGMGGQKLNSSAPLVNRPRRGRGKGFGHCKLPRGFCNSYWHNQNWHCEMTQKDPDPIFSDSIHFSCQWFHPVFFFNQNLPVSASHLFFGALDHVTQRMVPWGDRWPKRWSPFPNRPQNTINIMGIFTIGDIAFSALGKDSQLDITWYNLIDPIEIYPNHKNRIYKHLSHE